MKFINGLTLLLFFQLTGEVISFYFSLSITGPVIGMLLLFLSLLLIDTIQKNNAHKQQRYNALNTSATALLSHLSLLFIPAGVGLLLHISRLENQWLAIIAAIVSGSIITMTVTAWLMMLLNRLLKIENKKEDQR